MHENDNPLPIALLHGLSVYAITYMYRYTDGPFDVFQSIRLLLGFKYHFEKDDSGQVYIREETPEGTFGKLVSCVWCLSFWLSVIICVLSRKKHMLIPIASTGLSGLLHEVSDG